MLEAVLFRYGSDDLELWQLNIPEEAEAEIMEILMRYDTRGCSIRGSKETIANEIKTI